MRLESRPAGSPPLCELCHEPIEDNYCILFPLDRRCTHTSCMRDVLTNAFFGKIGIHDDDITDMVTESIIDALTDVPPLEAEYLE